MYAKQLPFHDFNSAPRNTTLHFNLTEPEFIKLLVEIKAIYDWQEKIDTEDTFKLDTAEVVEFYNNFEEIVLAAYGVPSEDGLYFDKSGKYRFAESAAFAAYLVETLSDRTELERFMSKVLPKGMDKIIKAADANAIAAIASDTTSESAKAEIERLRAALAQAQAGTTASE